MTTGRVPPALAADLGGGFTSVWSPHGAIVGQPSVVAVDGRGAARAHGFGAIRESGRRTRGLRLAWPFEAGEVRDARLAREHLLWAIEETGRRRFRGTVILPLHSTVPHSVRSTWRALVESVRAESLFVDRPVTAALGLGLDVDAPRAHLLVELTGRLVEVAVVVEGSVVAARLVDRSTDGLGAVAATIRRLLTTLDPDHELDIRDDGIHFHGWSLERDAAEVAGLVDLPVSARSTMPSAVISGARRVLEATLPYLARV